MASRGLNQPQLGQMVGVHKNSVNRWVTRSDQSIVPCLGRL